MCSTLRATWQCTIVNASWSRSVGKYQSEMRPYVRVQAVHSKFTSCMFLIWQWHYNDIVVLRNNTMEYKDLTFQAADEHKTQKEPNNV